MEHSIPITNGRDSMKMKYTLDRKDFVELQLFNATKSVSIQKKKRRETIYLTLGALLAAAYFLVQDHMAMTIWFLLVAVVTVSFYPKYFKRKYKKHYEKYIDEHYAKRFGEKVELALTNEAIWSRNQIGEGTLYLSEIDRVNETQHHFFLHTSAGPSMIIPKRELDTLDQFRAAVAKVNIPVIDDKNWSW